MSSKAATDTHHPLPEMGVTVSAGHHKPESDAVFSCDCIACTASPLDEVRCIVASTRRTQETGAGCGNAFLRGTRRFFVETLEHDEQE
jgi:plastocyanin domain-containing protein